MVVRGGELWALALALFTDHATGGRSLRLDGREGASKKEREGVREGGSEGGRDGERRRRRLERGRLEAGVGLRRREGGRGEGRDGRNGTGVG